MADKNIVIKNLRCSNFSCCPDAVVNTKEGTVTLTEGAFQVTLSKASADVLADLLAEHGFGKLSIK